LFLCVQSLFTPSLLFLAFNALMLLIRIYLVLIISIRCVSYLIFIYFIKLAAQKPDETWTTYEPEATKIKARMHAGPI
jgi:hypothetical protein